MAIAYSNFLEELYEEHLEELSFIYEQERALRADLAVAWDEVDEFERRRGRHLAALKIGEAPAISAALENFLIADAGDYFAAVVCVCACLDQAALLSLVEELDVDSIDQLEAIDEALIQFADPARVKALSPNLLSAEGLKRALGLKLTETDRLSELLVKPDGLKDIAPDAVAWLISNADKRLVSACVEPLYQVATTADPAVPAAGETLVRHGYLSVMRKSIDSEATMPSALVSIAAGSGPSLIPTILSKLSPTPTAWACNAAGIHGAGDYLPPLLEALKVEECARSAARALRLISGAPGMQQQSVEALIDEDELFPEELELLSGGKKPEHLDGEPFTEDQVNLNIDYDYWHEWLYANKQLFARGVFFRFGRPVSPTGVIELLLASETDPWIRRALSNDLLVRYGLTGFDDNASVAEQRAVLTKLHATAAGSEQFDAGHWYYDGQPVS